MFKKLLLLVLVAALCAGGFTLAQDGDNPTLAILRYGGTEAETTFSEFGVLDMLQARGYISAEERQSLDTRADLDGENISIFWGDAGWDLATANLMVDDALGRDADVLVTVTTPVTRAALNATADMDEPPPLLFASVFNPLEAGIAQPVCDKPAHATGSEIRAPYERALAVLLEQNPNLTVIGVISSSSEISGITGAAQISALAEAQGIEVERTAVISLPDFPLAARSLADAAVDAIIAPIDAVTAQALPVISEIANENGIPFLYPVLGAVYHGATFGVGFMEHYEQGLHLGRLLTGVLDGELDTAATGIRVFSGESHSVNLDAADEQGIEIAAGLLDSADITVSGGEDSKSAAFAAAYAIHSQEYLASDEAREAGAAVMESLACE